MRLAEYSVEKFKKEILEIISRYLDLKEYRLFFFGSRVKGDNFARADIDIGIEGEKEIPAEIILNIKEELEKLPLLYKIDFIDFKKVSKKFKEGALKYVEEIN